MNGREMLQIHFMHCMNGRISLQLVQRNRPHFPAGFGSPEAALFPGGGHRGLFVSARTGEVARDIKEHRSSANIPV